MTRQPLRLIWDPKDQLKDDEWLKGEGFLATGQETLVLGSEYVDKDLTSVLSNPHFLEIAAEKLGRPLQSIFVEGGAHTLKELFEDNSVDLVHVLKGQKELEPSPYQAPKSFFKSLTGWECLARGELKGDQLLEAMPQDRHNKIFAPAP